MILKIKRLNKSLYKEPDGRQYIVNRDEKIYLDKRDYVTENMSGFISTILDEQIPPISEEETRKQIDKAFPLFKNFDPNKNEFYEIPMAIVFEKDTLLQVLKERWGLISKVNIDPSLRASKIEALISTINRINKFSGDNDYVVGGPA